MTAMTAMLLVSAGFGAALLLLARALAPPRASLAESVARLDSRTPPLTVATVAEDEWRELTARLGRRLARGLELLGVRPRTKIADLAVIGRSAERHVADKCMLALAALAAGPGMVLVSIVVGLELAVPGVGLALLLAVVGFVFPDVLVRAEAERARRDFRHSFSAYLDWVTIVLAGGGGVEEALATAADEGDNWVFARIRAALQTARSHGEPPWKGLAALGEQLDLPTVGELARTIRLAEMEGARVRESLASKARALRAHGLTDAEAAARAATTQMALPVVLMFLGFVVFVGYPALSRMLAGS